MNGYNGYDLLRSFYTIFVLLDTFTTRNTQKHVVLDRFSFRALLMKDKIMKR
jgi:hypothetical protein